jgi:hypothetical protein
MAAPRTPHVNPALKAQRSTNMSRQRWNDGARISGFC